MIDPFGEERPRPKASHVLGEDLSALSVSDLDERIALLLAEVERLRADRLRKDASRAAASAAFRS